MNVLAFPVKIYLLVIFPPEHCWKFEHHSITEPYFIVSIQCTEYYATYQCIGGFCNLSILSHPDCSYHKKHLTISRLDTSVYMIWYRYERGDWNSRWMKIIIILIGTFRLFIKRNLLGGGRDWRWYLSQNYELGISLCTDSWTAWGEYTMPYC